MILVPALIYPVSSAKLVVAFLAATGWIMIIYLINQDINRLIVRREKLVNREFWNALLIFTGPLGMMLYLWYRTDRGKGPLKPDFPRRKARTREAGPKKVTVPSYQDPGEIKLYNHEGNLTHEGKRKWVIKKGGSYPDAVEEIRRIIYSAWRQRATDIHLESKAGKVMTRFRIDGVLHNEKIFPYREGQMVLSALKALAGMDVAERRKSLDGAFSAHWGERQADFRVASSSAIYGETLVLRLLDKSLGLIEIESLGLDSAGVERIKAIINYPRGMVLVSGPTGCGKTTTVYAMVSQIDATEKNIITIEDPIEYRLEGVTQIPVNPRAGISFANGLRSILRQDPDIILVGEIRDEETLQIAVQAALTGHLVFTTVHANDAVSTIMRLNNMEVTPNLISSSVATVISQELVRRLCPQCKEQTYELPEVAIKAGWEIEGPRYTARGCTHCRQTGYRGRIGIFEALNLTDRVKKVITQNLDAAEIKEVALEEGMVPIKEDGLNKVREGITTLEELMRVIPV